MSGTPGHSGRKPMTKAQKLLAGTYRRDQDNLNAPYLPPLERLPRCPAHIKGEGQKAWGRVGRLLLNMGVLTEADLHALEAYCTVYARWQDAETHLQQNGVMLSNAGKLFPSPYLKIAEDSSKAMRAWMTEFGITPSSRSRVTVERKESAILDNEDWFNEHSN